MYINNGNTIRKVFQKEKKRIEEIVEVIIADDFLKVMTDTKLKIQ